jgi:hypothetical protein
MPQEPDADAPLMDPDEPDWAEEIRRLRASRGDRLAEQLADDERKDPPVE